MSGGPAVRVPSHVRVPVWLLLVGALALAGSCWLGARSDAAEKNRARQAEARADSAAAHADSVADRARALEDSIERVRSRLTEAFEAAGEEVEEASETEAEARASLVENLHLLRAEVRPGLTAIADSAIAQQARVADADAREDTAYVAQIRAMSELVARERDRGDRWKEAWEGEHEARLAAEAEAALWKEAALDPWWEGLVGSVPDAVGTVGSGVLAWQAGEQAMIGWGLAQAGRVLPILLDSGLR